MSNDLEPQGEPEFDSLAAGEDIVERRETPWTVILIASGLVIAFVVSCVLM